MSERKQQALFSSRSELVRRLMLAEVIARRGEGPLAPRFRLPRVQAPVRQVAVEKPPEEPTR
jgi:hypothetical protein